jgi:hypothetical protein
MKFSLNHLFFSFTSIKQVLNPVPNSMVVLLSHRPGQGAVELAFSNSLIESCLGQSFPGLFLAWIA